jgi:hypothetical protein
MTNKVELNGKTYKVRTLKGERYVEVLVEELTAGMVLDQGVFAGLRVAMWGGEVNPRTWDVRLVDGMAYTESRGSKVRVWID